jgi:aminopeptidase N
MMGSMPSLTAGEATERARLLDVSQYVIDLDLTTGTDGFDSSCEVRFRAASTGVSTFAEIVGELTAAELNGEPLALDSRTDNRLPLAIAQSDNVLRVSARLPYSRTGEGIHRFVDPADGRVYLYAQSFLADAQRIFACFDQPDLKARLTVRVRAPKDWTVIGNERGEQTAPGQWEFAQTAPIPPYLFCICAGEFRSEYTEHDGIRLGLHCRASLAPALEPDLDELFTVTRQCFDQYHRMFEQRYPFGDTYDQVFVPEFNAGAMENPGCVTFRDELLFRSAVTDAEREVRACVVAHEMAHMWFGNLVSMRWWDDLWLNESFAEYMGYRVTTDVTRFESAWVEFGVSRKMWGYAADQSPSTHPISSPVADTGSALTNFDGISYAKGASALRQLVAWVGDEAFLAGINQHFQRHAYGNAALVDLLDALENSSGKPLKEWSRVWLEQPGVTTLAPLAQLDDKGRYRSVRIEQTAPAGYPVLRPHRIGVGLYRRQGDRVELDQRLELDVDPVVQGATTEVPELVGLPAADLLLLNDGDLTFAKIRLDPRALADLPDLLPDFADPLARALLWSAAWDMLRDAELPASTYIELVSRGLRQEDHPAVLDRLLTSSRDFPIDQCLTGADREAAQRTLASAYRDLLASAEQGSARQLVGVRGMISSAVDSADLDRLASWLGGDGVPEGVDLDAELRWALLRRLVIAGRAGADDIDAECGRDTSAHGAVHAEQCRAALPDPAAKSVAWQRLIGEEQLSNRVLTAIADGFWQAGQAELTAPYVQRYFTDVPVLARRQTDWIGLLVGRKAYPRFAVEESTAAAADELLAGDLPAGLRRALVDQTFELRVALAARTAFPNGTVH